MRKSVLLQSLFSAVLLSGSVQAQSVLVSTPAGQQTELSDRCLPLQFQHGRAAYRNCVSTLLQDAGADSPVLDFNERYAIATACSGAGDGDACIEEQTRAVTGNPPADLTSLGMEAVQTVEQRCLDRIGADAGVYRQCLADESAALGSEDQVADNAAAPVSNSAISGDSGTAADRSAGESVAQSAGTREGADESASSRSLDNTPDQGSAQATGEQGASSGNERESTGIAGGTSGEPAESATPDSPASGQDGPNDQETREAFDVRTTMERLSDALDELGRYSKLALGILVTAGGLVLLLLLYALLRRREPLDTGEAPMVRSPSARRTTAMHDADDSDDAMFDSLDQSLGNLPGHGLGGRLELDPTRRPVHTAAPDRIELALVDRHRPHVDLGGVDESAVTRLAVSPLAAASKCPDTVPARTAATDDVRNRHSREEALAEAPTETFAETFTEAPASLPAAEGGKTTSKGTPALAGFSRWLERQPAADRRALCTEFLVYWIAYADERYDPALKRRLSNAGELNTVDRLKHWALGGDPASFGSAVAWLSQNATRLQLGQSVSLIMALLITERSVTPVQTVMLRLLADAFDIGNDALEAEFEENFAEPLPVMPRPDRLSWWNQQTPQNIERWSSGQRPEDSTHRLSRDLLGLNDDVRDIDVIKAYRRAARRCHPDRFSALGSRERGLAVRQFDRFEQARDRLLGVLA